MKKDIFNQIADIIRPSAKYTFYFKGRQSGTIGIFYEISATYTAETLKEAVLMLYNDYEHIQFITGKVNTKDIDKDVFYNALN